MFVLVLKYKSKRRVWFSAFCLAVHQMVKSASYNTVFIIVKPISSCTLTACFSCSGKSSTNCYHLVTRFLPDFCKFTAKLIQAALSKLLQAGCHLVTMLMTVTDLPVKLFHNKATYRLFVTGCIATRLVLNL